jgi:hypothetical protein
MAYGPTHRVSCPSRSRNLVCKIPISLLGLSETNTIGYYPFHPLQGHELSVTSRPHNPELPVTVVDETGFGLRIPAWMVAPEAAYYQLAEQATLDTRTLRALAALLMPLLDDGIL